MWFYSTKGKRTIGLILLILGVLLFLLLLPCWVFIALLAIVLLAIAIIIMKSC